MSAPIAVRAACGTHASVAQLAEHLIVIRRSRGSNPRAGSTPVERRRTARDLFPQRDLRQMIQGAVRSALRAPVRPRSDRTSRSSSRRKAWPARASASAIAPAGRCRSGQSGQTVNLVALPSGVQIPSPPPAR